MTQEAKDKIRQPLHLPVDPVRQTAEGMKARRVAKLQGNGPHLLQPKNRSRCHFFAVKCTVMNALTTAPQYTEWVKSPTAVSVCGFKQVENWRRFNCFF
jgi:hypothetical protein